MKCTVPNETLDAVELSASSHKSLLDEADTVISETLAANEFFVSERASQLDPKHWKLVRTKDGLQVFRQRQKSIDRQRGMDSHSSPRLPSPLCSHDHAVSTYHTASKSSSGHGSTTQAFTFTPSGIAKDSVLERLRPPGVALLAINGTIDGSLDDCMFGCFAPNDVEWKLRNAHINERLKNVRVLATIKEPTLQRPCQFLGVKWFLKELPPVLAGVVQQRDFLIMEAVGVTRDVRGDKVGYVLLQSVTLRDVPEFSHLGIIRGVMSCCHLFRQSGPGKVDVFSRGFFDSRGLLPGRLSIAIAAEAALCCANLVDLAYMKKLRWLLTHGGKATQRDLGGGQRCRPTRCEACSSKFTKLLLRSSGQDVACQLCASLVCTKCIVTKKIILDVLDSGAIEQRTFHFCLNCYMTAKHQSGWDMVRKSFGTWLTHNPRDSAAASGNPQQGLLTRDGRAQSRYVGPRGCQRATGATKIPNAGATSTSPWQLDRSFSDVADQATTSSSSVGSSVLGDDAGDRKSLRRNN